jgi:dynein heavy chain 1
MFAGIASFTLDKDMTSILGMVSPEGEQVPWPAPVAVKDSTIIDWLSKAELQMKLSLVALLGDAIAELTVLQETPDNDKYARSCASACCCVVLNSIPRYLAWIDKYPAQLIVVASQVLWAAHTEKALLLGAPNGTPLADAQKRVDTTLIFLANNVMHDIPASRRIKYEHLITELVHQRDTLRKLVKGKVASNKDFAWLYEMRFYWNPREEQPLKRLQIQIANASFLYACSLSLAVFWLLPVCVLTRLPQVRLGVSRCRRASGPDPAYRPLLSHVDTSA